MDSHLSARTQTVKLNLNGREQALELTRQGDVLQLFLDGKQRHAWIRRHEGQSLILDVEQEDGSTRRLHLVGMAAGDQRQVWINGRLFHYERARPQRHSAPAADGSLASTIPAVVAQILVSPGDNVQAGDKLILLESMKMVIPIQAPYDGRVQQINCTVGDSVAAGIALIELQPQPQPIPS